MDPLKFMMPISLIFACTVLPRTCSSASTLTLVHFAGREQGIGFEDDQFQRSNRMSLHFEFPSEKKLEFYYGVNGYLLTLYRTLGLSQFLGCRMASRTGPPKICFF
ncbi:hypothetical protein ABW19_dt0206629 [Dactylella cylindrospora]|nr:hypothetical protein ABW19_dt0206629 [Dactylella cylindrospora]